MPRRAGLVGGRRPRRRAAPVAPRRPRVSARLAVVPVENRSSEPRSSWRCPDPTARSRTSTCRFRRRRSRVISRWGSEGAHSRGAARAPRPARRGRERAHAVAPEGLRRAQVGRRDEGPVSRERLARDALALDGDHRRRDVPAGLRRRPGGARGDGGGHPHVVAEPRPAGRRAAARRPPRRRRRTRRCEEIGAGRHRRRKRCGSPEPVGRANRRARSRASRPSPPIPRVSRGRSPISWTTRSSSARTDEPVELRVAPLRLRDARGARSPAWRSRCSTEDPGSPRRTSSGRSRPFEQGGDPLTGKPAGVGLGLYEARAIARRHGGTLIYLPRPGGGSEFRISIPAEVGGRRGDSRGRAVRDGAGEHRVTLASDPLRMREAAALARAARARRRRSSARGGARAGRGVRRGLRERAPACLRGAAATAASTSSSRSATSGSWSRSTTTASRSIPARSRRPICGGPPESGYGLYLIASLVDDVSFGQAPLPGRRVVTRSSAANVGV